ncbi:MAG: hypothetical protein FJY56_16975 [Betaproteobacteria bacterium]|nr:hypothetical protein [Betaproteobacteria bacterium]
MKEAEKTMGSGTDATRIFGGALFSSGRFEVRALYRCLANRAWVFAAAQRDPGSLARKNKILFKIKYL